MATMTASISGGTPAATTNHVSGTNLTMTAATSDANNASTQQPRPASRRPPRKSTLTQQQKNQKRQRATQEQLVTLELEFKKNPTPTAAVREQIAEDINMTERSVQIWFQNRRAKIKMIAKRGIETGEDCEAVPESMRRYLALQLDPSSANARNLLGRGGAYRSNEPLMHPATSSKTLIHHFNCRSLRIGTWRRIGQNTMDLVIFYSPDQSCMTYYINNDSAGYKIEYPFSHIKNITLEPGDPVQPMDGAMPRSGGLIIELNRPPNFFMDCSNSGGFYPCGDFTEDQQATKSLRHHLGGHPKVLSVQLARLVSLESFLNRHAQYAYAPFAPTQISSPLIVHRPASQPNQLARPQSGLSADNHLSVGLHPGRGHKRQRSRSVPAPVDFSTLHTSMSPYHFQQPSSQFQSHQNIFAPIPQSHIPMSMVGPDLGIDTAAGYNLDMHSYPMSATAASSSEFASPIAYATAAPPDPSQPAQLGTPYSLPFLSPSPVVDHMNIMTQTNSPLSHLGQGEPMIAEQSPPLTATQRSSPADIFSLHTDTSCTGPDDGLLLSEMYSKQNLNMSMPSPEMEMDDTTFALTLQGLQDHNSPSTPTDFRGMLPFETVDPSTLAAES
ncbi:hypothetical protein FQN57_006027 [Myotisia sp. PD_48]|nr:hypothetical protein FQN57_006027 [Myotisia sp. PD_48]